MPVGAELVLFFGYMSAYKGIEYLLEEIRLLLQRRMNTHIVIAGGVPSRLKAFLDPNGYVQRLGTNLDRVHFRGFVPSEQLDDLFGATDALISLTKC